MNSAYNDKLRETLKKLNPQTLTQEEFFEMGAQPDENSNYQRNYGAWKKDCLNWREARTKRRQNT